MVGLIIGKGGENISRIQDSTGAKLQLGQEPQGDKRSCIIYGTPSAIAKCKEMVNEIIEKEGQRHAPVPTGMMGGGGPGGGMQHSLGIVTIEVHVPKHKVGQVIGKGGETIRMLQEKARVRMFLIQEVEAASPTKPIKITGDPDRVEYAKKLVEDMINTPDVGGPGAGQVQEQIRVPKASVGIVIGKGGETIRDIQNETGARVQFIGLDNPAENDKTCLISGKPLQVQEAKRMVEELLQNSTQIMKNPMQRKFDVEETYRVPATKTGVIIGKGGETIRQICERSGAKVELDRNHPATAEDRVFWMRGSRMCVDAAKRLIDEKLADQARNYGDGTSRPPGGGGGYYDGGAGMNWMDPNAQAAGDPSAAFWNAYCQQYYSMMGNMPGGPPMPGGPGMAPGMPPGAPFMPGMPPAELAQTVPTAVPDPQASAASYYYQAAANPAPQPQPAPASAAAVTTTEDGGQDFSRAWVEYYRSVGQHKEADDLEAMIKAKEAAGQ
ncbi:far upstream element-binding protein 1-like isoform X2 [Paramacrobiotus metropolitanus]|nr:far upstream element-binding protein 1-like isoform X2 [Paramacrobiotus metropolitanus]